MSGMYRKSRDPDRAMTSLRPRPVTATVTKPRWMRPEAIARPRSASVESHGSTASLTSVLDHDSCADLTDDEADAKILQKLQENKENKKSSQNINNNLQSAHPKKLSKKKVVRKYVESSQTEETENDESGLSPWEQWLIEKVKQDRLKKQEEREKKRQEREKKKQEKEIEQQKLRKAEETRKEWLDKKHFEENLKKKLEKQREKTETMIKEQEKKMVSDKAERKFKEWMEAKAQEEKEKKKEEKRKQKEEEEKQREQQQKAQKKYEEWCRKAKHRPRPTNNSFGYTSGKLTGYHDTSAYPVPAFYNPIPWQPTQVPKSTSDKSRKKRSNKPKPKYVWNPDKYL